MAERASDSAHTGRIEYLKRTLQVAMTYEREGRFVEAEAICRQVLLVDPVNPNAVYLSGMIAFRTGRFPEALSFIRRCIQIVPHVPPWHYACGRVLDAMNQPAEALACYEHALRLDDNFLDAHDHRGLALMQLGRLDEAESAFRRALQVDPASPQALLNLGLLLHRREQLPSAAERYREAISAAPDYAPPYHALGEVLMEMSDAAGAADCFRSEVRLRPDDAAAHFALAEALLMLGQYAEGWRELEWRWRFRFHRTPQRYADRARWDGSNAAGRTVLLHAEQGFGDVIQLIRYAPLVAGRGARVIVGCQPELAPLLSSADGICDVACRADAVRPFDLHLPMFSLPGVFGTTLQTTPSRVPYLGPPAARIEAWRRTLGLPAEDADRGPLRVGLAWESNRAVDPARDCPLEPLAQLAQVPGVRFYSLQKQAGHDAAFPSAVRRVNGMELVDFTTSLTDFAETAALISHLDLVISIDTAVAHLAGAMGKPTWTLLRHSADWRWLSGREDSPWYPTMRLFRQPSRGDWPPVVAQVTHALHEFRRHNEPMRPA